MNLLAVFEKPLDLKDEGGFLSYGEVGSFISSSGIGLVAPLERFSEAIRKMNDDTALRNSFRQRIQQIRPAYSWRQLFDTAFRGS